MLVYVSMNVNVSVCAFLGVGVVCEFASVFSYTGKKTFVQSSFFIS